MGATLDPEILRYYAAGHENDRLRQGPFQLERVRTEELRPTAMYGIEGPGWLAPDFGERWAEEARRRRLLDIARVVERESWLLAVSPHIMAVASRT
ncbi:MAG TPA: hypothetical protein VGQ78_02555 [Vicinamibacteria bacterium]|nr:hypothetical protein [Vicinamibacteria bacterium]